VEREVADAAVELARAAKGRAEAELERSRIRAPVAGTVLTIHARPGERVGEEGLLDLGRVDRMYAIAEVFETDIRAVRVGQRATATSEALAAPLGGRVERIRPRVRKLDVVGTDPAARKDARIVEVEILLDDPAAAAALTHLQVDVVIQTGP
jgi:HlyD family secretion protein